MRSRVVVCSLLLACGLAGPPAALPQHAAGAGAGELAELNAKIRRFAPTVVTADASRLSPGDRRALAKIVEEERVEEPLFLRQVWSGNVALERRLMAAPARVREAGRKLAGEILTLQAEGSYDRAKALLDRYAVVRPPMQRALDRLKGVPVDIEPSYPLAASAGTRGGRR